MSNNEKPVVMTPWLVYSNRWWGEMRKKVFTGWLCHERLKAVFPQIDTQHKIRIAFYGRMAKGRVWIMFEPQDCGVDYRTIAGDSGRIYGVMALAIRPSCGGSTSWLGGHASTFYVELETEE